MIRNLRISSALCFIFILIIKLQFAYVIQSKLDAEEYLKRFGYLKSTGVDIRFGGLNQKHGGKALDNAVSSFQMNSRLDVTGKLNKETIKMMNNPRCGNIYDRSKQPFRNSVYDLRRNESMTLGTWTITDYFWPKRKLTYRISEYGSYKNLSPKAVDIEINNAFSAWAQVVNLIFIKKDTEPVDIEINFKRKIHKVNEEDPDFDGPGIVLAHAFPPNNESELMGDIHFNTEEELTVSDTPDISSVHFRWVAIHEIGHSLGLSHTNDTDSYMFSLYPRNYDPSSPLGYDDIQAIQYIYGRPILLKAPQARLRFSSSSTIAPSLISTSDASRVTTNFKIILHDFKLIYYLYFGIFVIPLISKCKHFCE